MQRKFYLALFIAAFVPILVFAAGKIRGKVTDAGTGEPLVGANVVVVGTQMGAASNVSGEFVILNVPAGTFTIRTSYVGYQTITISNVRVNADITINQDFALPVEGVTVGLVEIVAERPLIQRNTTNTVRITTQEDMNGLPVRGVQNILALQAGVVSQGGNLYVRGGRNGEVSYYVDGAPTTNPLFNTSSVSVVQEGVEEIQLQAGGYTAEYGGSNSGIVRTSVRTGGSEYKASFGLESDDFAKPGKEFLGTTSQGYRNVVATLGGPIPGVEKLRFFVLYQNNFVRQRQLTWLTPFDFSLTEDSQGSHPEGSPLPGAVSLKENYLPKSWEDQHQVQGTLQADLSPIKIRLTGTYQYDNRPNGGIWPDALYNIFRQNRFSLTADKSLMLNLRASHALDASTFYEVGISYFNRTNETTDPTFGKNWQSWTDSLANAAIGYTGFRSRYTGPPDYSVIDGFNFRNEFSPNTNYQINSQHSFGVSVDLTRQMNKTWEVKVGGRFDTWVMRNFNIANIGGYMEWLHGTYGTSDRIFADAATRRAELAVKGSINNYGYDVDGNVADGGLDPAYKPSFISAYVQNKFEYRDLVLNVGLRYEYYNPNHLTFANPLTANATVNPDLNVIDETQLVRANKFQMVLPRISFSFPVTDNTVFYAQYGKYAQMPSLNQVYDGLVAISRTVSLNSRGNAYLTPVGFLAEPERTTQYEMGFRQMLSENFALTLSGFYKDMRNQLQIRNMVDATGNKLYLAYTNDDFGTTKGLELTLELRRTHNFAARLNYTLSDARGTGSNSNAAAGIVEIGIGRQINSINPLSFNQTHRGTALLDYRWPTNVSEQGPILSGLGASLLFSFNSGHPYTEIKGLTSLGQSDPFTVGTTALTDPRSSNPSEALNSSSTPFFLDVDLSVSKMFSIGSHKIEVYANITNLLNTKQVINVYPTTGESSNDGWLTNTLAASYLAIPNYAAFYKAINLDNRWSYLSQTIRSGQYVGGDIYGQPRQIRFGLRFEI